MYQQTFGTTARLQRTEENTLQFIKINDKVTGLGGSNIAFRVHCNAGIIILISKEQENTSGVIT